MYELYERDILLTDAKDANERVKRHFGAVVSGASGYPYISDLLTLFREQRHCGTQLDISYNFIALSETLNVYQSNTPLFLLGNDKVAQHTLTTEAWQNTTAQFVNGKISWKTYIRRIYSSSTSIDSEELTTQIIDSRKHTTLTQQLSQLMIQSRRSIELMSDEESESESKPKSSVKRNKRKKRGKRRKNSSNGNVTSPQVCHIFSIVYIIYTIFYRRNFNFYSSQIIKGHTRHCEEYHLF